MRQLTQKIADAELDIWQQAKQTSLTQVYINQYSPTLHISARLQICLAHEFFHTNISPPYHLPSLPLLICGARGVRPPSAACRHSENKPHRRLSRLSSKVARYRPLGALATVGSLQQTVAAPLPIDIAEPSLPVSPPPPPFPVRRADASITMCGSQGR